MPDEKKYYCGIGPVPKGKERGTPEYCVQTNQVRYYGIVKIDKDLLKTAKGTVIDLVKEQLKLKKLQDDGKLLIKNVKNLRVILDDDTIKKSKRKKAQAKMDELFEKKDKLVKKIKAQKKYVENLEKEEKKKEKKKKKKKKNGSKTGKK